MRLVTLRSGLVPSLALLALAASLPGTTSERVAQAAAADCFLRGATVEEAANRASPLGQTTFTLGGEEGVICYGRPSANEREVFGGLVPYGSPWRLGANEATSIHMPVSGTIGDVEVEAGTYSLYVVPSATEWVVHVNRQVERWGIPINAGVMGEDVGTFVRPVAETEGMVETFTVSWASHGAGMGHLVFEWENTRVEVPLHSADL